MLTEVMNDLTRAIVIYVDELHLLPFLLNECAIAEVSSSINVSWFNVNGLGTDTIRASKKLVQMER